MIHPDATERPVTFTNRKSKRNVTTHAFEISTFKPIGNQLLLDVMVGKKEVTSVNPD